MLDGRRYVVGPPREDSFWERLLEVAEQDGVESASMTVRESPVWGPTRSDST